jgi:hypothetical protein
MCILPCFVIQKNMQWVVRGRRCSGERIRRKTHKYLIFNELYYTRRIYSPLQKVEIMQI